MIFSLPGDYTPDVFSIVKATVRFSLELQIQPGQHRLESGELGL